MGGVSGVKGRWCQGGKVVGCIPLFVPCFMACIKVSPAGSILYGFHRWIKATEHGV